MKLLFLFFFFFSFSLKASETKEPEILFALTLWVKHKHPECLPVKQILSMNQTQMDKYTELTSEKLDTPLGLKFNLKCPGNPDRAIYLDSQKVKLFNQMMAVEIKENKIKSMDYVMFYDSAEYKLDSKTLDLYKEKNISEIEGVDTSKGSSLSHNALKKSLKKILALDKILTP